MKGKYNFFSNRSLHGRNAQRNHHLLCALKSFFFIYALKSFFWHAYFANYACQIREKQLKQTRKIVLFKIPFYQAVGICLRQNSSTRIFWSKWALFSVLYPETNTRKKLAFLPFKKGKPNLSEMNCQLRTGKKFLFKSNKQKKKWQKNAFKIKLHYTVIVWNWLIPKVNQIFYSLKKHNNFPQ